MQRAEVAGVQTMRLCKMRADPAQYGLQRFDVAAWAKGTHSGADSAKPDTNKIANIQTLNS